MYLQLDDYPPYSGKNPDIFETRIDSKLRCIHVYTNCMRHTDFITWVSNSAWDILLSGFNRAVKINPCPRTKICNKCAQNNMSGDIFNTGDNADDKVIFGFSESYFKTSPRHLDGCTKNKLLNLQQENMRPQTNIENTDKIPDEKYQKNKPDVRNSDERYQIRKINKKK